MSKDKTKLEQEVNIGGSMIEDHAYMPRDPSEPWGLCHCGLAEASHAKVVLSYLPTAKRAAKETPDQKTTDRIPVEYNGKLKSQQ